MDKRLATFYTRRKVTHSKKKKKGRVMCHVPKNLIGQWAIIAIYRKVKEDER